MIVEKRDTSQRQRKEALVYMGQEVTFLEPSTACRYLGVWGTPTGICQIRKKGFKCRPVLPASLTVSRSANRRFEQSNTLRNSSLSLCLLCCCRLRFISLSFGLH
jgi:hypothetical protein